MELLQNTILKLIFRQGTNTERMKVVFSSGEPAWTTDTNRLWIGNSVLSGGVLVGNKFQGSGTDVTAFTEAEIGDLAYDTDNNALYRLRYTQSTDLSSWQMIGGVYASGDSYIAIDPSNTITLNSLSSGIFHDSAVLSPITLSGGQIALRELSAYHVSSDALSSPLVISAGQIALSTIPANLITSTLTISSGLVGYVNGIDKTNTEVRAASGNIMIQTNELYARYDGSGSSLTYSRNIVSVDKLSGGWYRFNFLALPSANIIPQAQIIGTSPANCYPRVTAITTTTCEVQVLSTNGVLRDADLTLTITY